MNCHLLVTPTTLPQMMCTRERREDERQRDGARGRTDEWRGDGGRDGGKKGCREQARERVLAQARACKCARFLPSFTHRTSWPKPGKCVHEGHFLSFIHGCTGRSLSGQACCLVFQCSCSPSFCSLVCEGQVKHFPSHSASSALSTRSEHLTSRN